MSSTTCWGRIQKVLGDRRYEFFNLSLGPHVPTEDDEVHPWTAVLDEHLADGHAFATIAVGNSGETPEPRIQIPGDCVNGVSVGAADSTRDGWARSLQCHRSRTQPWSREARPP